MISFKGQSGFSLVEILVALGLMGVLSFVFATTVSSNAKQMGQLEAKQQSLGFVSELQTNLFSPDTCSLLLQANKNIRIDPTLAATDKGQPVNLEINGKVIGSLNNAPKELSGYDRLRVDGFSLSQLHNTGMIAQSGDTIYSVSLTTDLHDEFNNISFKRKSVGQFTLTARTSNNEITSCYIISNASQSAEDVCRGMGGSIDSVSKKCVLDKESACRNLGGSYNASKATCVMHGQAQCEAMGGTWKNNTCTMQAKQQCEDMGGTWDGKTCSMGDGAICGLRGVNCITGSPKYNSINIPCNGHHLTATCKSAGSSGSGLYEFGSIAGCPSGYTPRILDGAGGLDNLGSYGITGAGGAITFHVRGGSLFCQKN